MASPKPRLWTVFAAVGFSAFGLAVLGLALLALYDDQLIRQTETELIAQSAAIAQTYTLLLQQNGVPADYGNEATEPWPFPIPAGSDLKPILPSLRSGGRISAAPDEPTPSTSRATPAAQQAGAALTAALKNVGRTTLAGIRIVDPGGVVVAASYANAIGTRLDRAEIDRALRGAPNSMLRRRNRRSTDGAMRSLSRNAAVRVSVAIPALHNGRVVGAVLAVRTPMTVRKAIYNERRGLASTVLILAAAIALMSLLAARLIIGPLRRLVDQAGAIAMGTDRTAPVGRPAIYELSELSTALSSMAESLREKNAYIQSFTANISHEFKTPLASIRGAVELLADDFEAMDSSQRQRFLENIRADAERLDRLVAQLLALAKADAMTSEAAQCPARETIAEVVQRARDAEIRIDAEIDTSCVVKLPAAVLDGVLWQLFDNARLHGGDVTVRLRAKTEEDALLLEVWDDGGGIQDPSQIFRPCFTTAADQGGTGLGLVIGRSMLRTFGGELSLVDPAQARFQIRVPRAHPPRK